MATDVNALNEATIALSSPIQFVHSTRVAAIRGDCVALEKSNFYPNLSAQPCDRGRITRLVDEAASQVDEALFDGRMLWHRCKNAALFDVGDKVICNLERNWRHYFSRSHSAAVLVAGVVHRRWTNSIVTSCCLKESHIRLDFESGPHSQADVEETLMEANKYISRDGSVTSRMISMDEAKANPKFLRSDVLVGDFDHDNMGDLARVVCIKCEGEIIEEQFDLGTHVDRLSEIGEVCFGTRDGKRGCDNKGRRYYRMQFYLKTGSARA
jgi:Ser-tRNA(Ala) deacylase AlaX